MKDFSTQLPRRFLDIQDKTRSNIFAWRGQFSPQLVQYLLEAYCPSDAVVLDPFVGSGTILHEAARMGLQAYGYEINPAAWIFSKTYEFANVERNERKRYIQELRRRIDAEFPIAVFSGEQLSDHQIEQKVIAIGDTVSDRAKILLNALIILLDLANNKVTNDLVQSRFFALSKLVENLPHSERLIKAELRDARSLPLSDGSADFVITSPP